MNAQDTSAEPKPDLPLEIAYLLSIDVVGYSKLLVNEQIELLQDLNQIVRTTERFRTAETKGKLIRVSTGDGMVLLFFHSPEEPVRCALEISRTLQEHLHIQLRLGVHSGPVNQVTDVNEKTNIAGPGINVAQRVMDCGDAGHILLSRHIAEDLTQYRHWQPYLHDLGECEVKHGQRLHLVNLYKNNLGNPHVPDKLKRRRTWKRKYTRAQYTRFSNRDCFPPASSSFRSASVRWKRVSKCLHELTVCDAFGIASPVHFKNRQHQLLEKWNHWRGCGLDYKFCVSASQKPI